MTQSSALTIVILAGGLGTRLRAITRNLCPKPMVPVPVGDGSAPFLEFILAQFRGQGVTDFVICTGHFGQQIIDHFGDGSQFGLTIRYDDAGASDTGLRVLSALPLVAHDPFLVVCGDTFLAVDVDDILNDFATHDTLTCLLAVTEENGNWVENVVTAPDGLVLAHGKIDGFKGRPSLETGTFAMRREALAGRLPSQDFSLTKHLFPQLITSGVLGGFVVQAPFFDIGTPAGYQRFCEYVAAGKAKPLSRVKCLKRSRI